MPTWCCGHKEWGEDRDKHTRTCSTQLTCIIHTLPPPHWLSMRASVKSCSRKGVIQHFSQSVARLAATCVTAVTVTVTDVNLIGDKIGTCSMKPATPQESENTEERLSRCFITPIHQKEKKNPHIHILWTWQSVLGSDQTTLQPNVFYGHTVYNKQRNNC